MTHSMAKICSHLTITRQSPFYQTSFWDDLHQITDMAVRICDHLATSVLVTSGKFWGSISFLVQWG